MSFLSGRFTVLCLVLSLLLQSITAVVGTLNIHQYDPEHAQTSHSHNQDIPEPAVNITSAQDAHNTADCHHCGHCSGLHLHALSSKVSGILFSLFSSDKIAFLATLPASLIQDFLRPPIS